MDSANDVIASLLKVIAGADRAGSSMASTCPLYLFAMRRAM